MKGRGAGTVVGMNHEKNGTELLQVTDFMVTAFKEVNVIFFSGKGRCFVLKAY